MKKNKLKLSVKENRILKFYISVIMVITLTIGTSISVYAADDPLAVVNNLSNFIFGIVRGIGLILTGLGIVQVGLAFKSHDPSQRANGFLTVVGGIIITFAKEILNIIIG